ncbi:MAG: polysaccharide deacetylase family protein [Bacteroidales bacterium]|nr:polysaccharide deacetylase family protein [Bacteroidales bacterium]
MNILTFDIEDWFLSKDSGKIPIQDWAGITSRVEHNTDVILDLLASHQVTATFFILGWVAREHPELVKRISAAGHDIGYHSFAHQRIKELSHGQFEVDLVKGLDIIETLLGEKVRYYRAPYFSLDKETPWTVEALIRHGIEVSSSTKSFSTFLNYKIQASPFVINHGNRQLIEFPLTRLDVPILKLVVTGSGYFRALPLPLILRYLRAHHYNMFYFHPRDFDIDTPYSSRLSLGRNLLNHVGVQHVLRKFDRMLSQVSFISIGEAAAYVQKHKEEFQAIDFQNDEGTN